MAPRPVPTARSVLRWPFDLAYEVLQVPTTMRNIRHASERIGSVIDEVGGIAKRADGSLDGIDTTLGDLKVVTRALSMVAGPAQAVGGQWRRSMRDLPFVGWAAGERERWEELEGPDDDEA